MIYSFTHNLNLRNTINIMDTVFLLNVRSRPLSQI